MVLVVSFLIVVLFFVLILSLFSGTYGSFSLNGLVLLGCVCRLIFVVLISMMMVAALVVVTAVVCVWLFLFTHLSTYPFRLYIQKLNYIFESRFFIVSLTFAFLETATSALSRASKTEISFLSKNIDEMSRAVSRSA